MAFPLPEPMRVALDAAARAGQAGEVPIGAVVTCEGNIVAVAANRMRSLGNPMAHAEMEAMRLALATLGTGRLDSCDLWVTLEPCAMCAGAIAHARLRRLYYGAGDEKGGAVAHGPRFFGQSTCHHRPDVYAGIGEAESAAMLRAFFADRR